MIKFVLIYTTGQKLPNVPIFYVG